VWRCRLTAKTRYWKAPADGHFSLASISWLFGTLILVQCAGLVIPGHLSWGFNYWRSVSIEVAVVVLGLGLIIMHPALNIGLAKGVARTFSSVSNNISRLHRPSVLIVVSLLLFLLFYLFRSRAHVYGDGFLALDVASTPLELWPFNEYFMKPLSMLLYRFMIFFVAPLINVGSANILSALNAGAGLAGFWALFRLSRLLVSGTGRQWFMLTGSLAGGNVVLFFGYIEYYPLAIVLALWSLVFSIGYLRGQNRLWPALLVSIIATGVHLFAAPTVVLAIIAGWISPGKDRDIKRRLSFLRANLTVVGLSVVAAALFQLSNHEGPVITLWPTQSASYWAFGFSHLLDIANEILLVAPLGLIGLVVALFRYRKSKPVGPTENLLISISLFLFLLSFWINPELGAARDWDLLSFFGFPFSLWGAFALLKALPKQVNTTGMLIQVLVVGLVIVVPNLYEKNNLVVAAERLDDILWHDPHYQKDYRQAYNSYHWGGTLIKDVGNLERSIRHLKRAAEVVDAPARRYASLASAYHRKGLVDSAYIYYHRALAKDPGNEKILSNVSVLELKAGRVDRLLALAQRAVEVNPGSGGNHHLLAFAYSRLGTQDSALVHSRLANKLMPETKRLVMQPGRIHGMMNQQDSAYHHIMRALELAGPERFDKRDYFALFSSALSIGQFDQARRAMAAIERLQPEAIDDNNSLWRVLDEAIDSAGQGN